MLMLWAAAGAHAQRASENAVTEATDAFGTVVGREVIGLYTSTSARGFSPTEAGNLRIAGLHFDQNSISAPTDRVVRGSAVHVGLSAQGFPFPAPTGVVDFQLRTPGDDFGASMLLGVASFDQAYFEFDAHAPAVTDVLSVGGGFGYSRNSGYLDAHTSDDLNFGAIAHWRPTDALTVTPFWSGRTHRDNSAKPSVYIGTEGIPRFRADRLPWQSWTDWSGDSRNFGVVVQADLSETWLLEFGAFRSGTTNPDTNFVFLTDVDARGRGEYSIAFAPKRDMHSTSGEARLTKSFETSNLRSKIYVSLKGRDRYNEFGGIDQHDFGPGTTTVVPKVPEPDFQGGPLTRVWAQQLTPALAYEGIWRGLGQLNLGLQKSNYRRKIAAPDAPELSSRSDPWLYNASAAVSLTPSLAIYGSATRGFEEVGYAPAFAENRYEAVAAQLTRQVDAGLRYQFSPSLQLVAGAFRIDKPYFDLDLSNYYRQIGRASNRGLEFSLSGALTEQLTVVAGYTHIDPRVRFQSGASVHSTAVAVGPIPGLLRANLQYEMVRVAGLVIDGGAQRTSGRYARYPQVFLPSVTTFDLGARYSARILDRSATWRLQLLNLGDAYALTPNLSGYVIPLNRRSFELSVAIDL